MVAANQDPSLNRKCQLSQITGDPTVPVPPPAAPVIDMNGAARFHSSPAAAPTFNATTSRLFNLGPATDLSLHTWSINRGYLALRGTDMPGSTGATGPATVVDNIVSIKAQYGFDTRSAAVFEPDTGVQRTGMVVNVWSSAMINADGDTVVGNSGDWNRIAAIRLAIVARGRQVQKPAANGSCNWTTTAPSLFSTSEPEGVTAVPVVPDLSVANDTMNWQCYRYRVFETIVPIRNAGWRPTANNPTT